MFKVLSRARGQLTLDRFRVNVQFLTLYVCDHLNHINQKVVIFGARKILEYVFCDGILGVRKLNISAVAPAVGLYISAGYWFTSSTSFANPAVTLARGFTNTFTGIDPQFIIAFIVFQVLGTIMAMVFMKYLQED